MLALDVGPLCVTTLEVAHMFSKAAGLTFLESTDSLVVIGADEPAFLVGTDTVGWQTIQELFQGHARLSVLFATFAFALWFALVLAFASRFLPSPTR